MQRIDYYMRDEIKKHNEENKQTIGKPRYSLLCSEILTEITKIREYGIAKYKESDNWKKVDKQLYLDAAMRHMIKLVIDGEEVDNESGLKHASHAACNLMFYLEMIK